MPRRPASSPAPEPEQCVGGGGAGTSLAPEPEQCVGGGGAGTWEAMGEFEGCLLTGGSSPPRATAAVGPRAGAELDTAATGTGAISDNDLEAAAAAAGWSMDDMECLARSIEEDVAAAGWSMDEVATMLDLSMSPQQETASAASVSQEHLQPHPDQQQQLRDQSGALHTVPVGCHPYGLEKGCIKNMGNTRGTNAPVCTAPVSDEPSTAVFEVNVQLLSGEVIALTCNPSDRLDSLQQRLEALTGITIPEQRLTLVAPGCRQLPTGGVNASLSSLGIDGSANVKLCAGVDDIVVSDAADGCLQPMDMQAWRFTNAEGSGCTAKQRAQFRKVVITVKQSVVEVTFPYDAKFVKLIKKVGGGGKARWQGQAKGGVWTVAPVYLSHLLELFPGATVLRLPATRELAKDPVSLERLLEAAELEQKLPNGWSLFAHQKEAVVAILQGRRQILAYDMGLGKTIISLVAAKAWQRVTNGAVLVICPVSMRSSWEKEAEVVDVVVSTHSWGSVPAVPPQTGSAGFFLIADEAHYMQNMQSKRTIAALKLCASAGALVLATGTPLKNARPSNLFPLLRAVKHPLAVDQRGYEVRYCNARKTRFNPWDISGSANLGELHEKIKGTILRKTKEEVLELPGKTRRRHDIAPTEEQRNEYNAKLRHAKAVGRGSTGQQQRSDSGGAVGGRNGEMSALMALRQFASLSKVGAAAELAAQALAAGEAVCVCCCFVESARLVHRHISDAGIKCELLTGETKQSDRGMMVDRFQRGGSQVFVFTAGAGGVGITLTAASTIILVDRAMTPGDVEQVEDRLNRIGQTRKVKSIWLRLFEVCKIVDEMLEKKQKKINNVLGENSTLEADETNGISAAAVLEQLFAEVVESPTAQNHCEREREVAAAAAEAAKDVLQSGETLSQFPSYGTLPGVYCGDHVTARITNSEGADSTARENRHKDQDDHVAAEWDQATRLAAAAERAREHRVQSNYGGGTSPCSCSTSSTEIRHTSTYTLISSSDEEEDCDVGNEAVVAALESTITDEHCSSKVGDEGKAINSTETQQQQLQHSVHEVVVAAQAPALAQVPDRQDIDPNVARLMDMGFTREQASAALSEHPNNPEGALMWLLNRARCAREARAREKLQIIAAATAVEPGANNSVAGKTQQHHRQQPLDGRSFKATCGPVPRSPSVLHASPEPSRANRPCVLEQHRQEQRCAPLAQPKLQNDIDENTDPQQPSLQLQQPAGDDDVGSAKLRQLRLTGPTTSNYMPTWRN